MLELLNSWQIIFTLFFLGLAIGGEFARRRAGLTWPQIFERLRRRNNQHR